MAIEEPFIIPIEKPSKDFQAHMDLEDNQRIVFSGIFGIGKTYFLKKFFEQNEEKYNSIHLFPVNYSISSNEDIFETLKYDVLLKLLDFDIDFEKMEVSTLEAAPFFIEDNYRRLISNLLSNIPKIGTISSKAFDNLNALDKKRETLEIDDHNEALNFLRKFEMKPGSIYENDSYSELIGKLLGQISENGKENVLIIDDLDRVDPEHVFRLLNVFAAHFDTGSNQNKLGFDRVIFVFDIENIRNIFSNRYGQDVDFSGYIDKFYSTDVFHFDNKEAVSNYIDELVSTIRNPGTLTNAVVFEGSHNFGISVRNILKSMVFGNVINLRALLKLYKKDYPVRTYGMNLQSFPDLTNAHFVIVLTFDFLIFLFGNIDGVFQAIDKLERISDSIPKLKGEHRMISELIKVLDINGHKWMYHQQFGYVNKELEIEYIYSIKGDGYDMFVTLNKAIKHKTGFEKSEQEVSDLKYFKLLNHTAKYLQSLNIY